MTLFGAVKIPPYLQCKKAGLVWQIHTKLVSCSRYDCPKTTSRSEQTTKLTSSQIATQNSDEERDYFLCLQIAMGMSLFCEEL